MITGMEGDRARRRDDFGRGVVSGHGLGSGKSEMGGGKKKDLRQGYRIIHQQSWRASRLNMELLRRGPPNGVTTRLKKEKRLC